MSQVSSLSDLPLFSGLNPTECAAIEGRMRKRDYAPQSVIVGEGTPGDAAFVILSGLVAVRRRDAASGVEFMLSELGPGQVFGEMALLTHRPRVATVVALEPRTCAVLERSDFEQVPGNTPRSRSSSRGSARGRPRDDPAAARDHLRHGADRIRQDDDVYSALAEINEPGVNISTAEDPIEYDLSGVTQIQANPSIGLTFAAILRAFLRAGPRRDARRRDAR